MSLHFPEIPGSQVELVVMVKDGSIKSSDATAHESGFPALFVWSCQLCHYHKTGLLPYDVRTTAAFLFYLFGGMNTPLVSQVEMSP